MDTASHDELLRRWCDGDDAAGNLLLGYRIHDADLDQKLLTRCAAGQSKALARFSAIHFADLDPELLQRLRDSGRLQAELAVRDGDVARLARWAAGNRGSGNALFEAYYPVLFRFVTSKVGNQEAAKDIVQETFRDLTRQHASIQSFRPFMFKVAANKVRKWFVEQYGSPVDAGVSGISELPVGSQHHVEAVAERHLEYKQLLLALQRLPLDHQMLLELYIWEDFTATELVKIFGIPLHTVRYIIRTAKQALQKIVAEVGEQRGSEAETTELQRFLDELCKRAQDRVAGAPPRSHDTSHPA